MSRECNERMWNLAYRLAHCGEHRNYQAIEWQLQASSSLSFPSKARKRWLQSWDPVIFWRRMSEWPSPAYRNHEGGR
jgi:hypothetical protein